MVARRSNQIPAVALELFRQDDRTLPVAEQILEEMAPGSCSILEMSWPLR
jgi:hypothetical protein